MRISDWSSDVCSSDLRHAAGRSDRDRRIDEGVPTPDCGRRLLSHRFGQEQRRPPGDCRRRDWRDQDRAVAARSEEHTSELQSLMRISYAVFCLKKKKYNTPKTTHPLYIIL